MKKIVFAVLVIIIALGCITREGQETAQIQSEIAVTDYDLARYVSGHTSGSVKP